MINVLLAVLAFTIPPVNDTRIVDQAGLLSAGQSQELSKLFTRVETEQGVKLGLLTTNALDDDPKAVSVRTLNFWQMSPDSVLIFVSTNPKKVFLQPGSNLSYQFTESVSVGIIRDNIVPALKSGRYGVGILNGFSAISAKLPGPAVATPNTPQRPEPIVMAPVTVSGPPTYAHTDDSEDSFPSRHPFYFFLLVSSGLVGLYFLIRWAINRNKEEQKAYNPYPQPKTYPQSYNSYPQSNASATVVPQPVVVNNVNQGNSDFVNGMVLGEVLSSRPSMNVVVTPVTQPTSYSPPPVTYKPAYTPPPSPPTPSRSSSDDDNSSSGSGGGGSSWGSSSSDSSDSSGGGGAIVDAISSIFDSSSGGGGGGSDW